MIRISSRSILIIGFVLVLLGVALPFLIVMKVLESTFFLNFFSFAASVLGLFLGILGGARFAIEIRNSSEEQ